MTKYLKEVYKELEPLFRKVSTPKQEGREAIRKILGRLAKEVKETPDEHTKDELWEGIYCTLLELEELKRGLFQDYVEKHHQDDKADPLYKDQPDFAEEFSDLYLFDE